ncbi:hypothetical protein [Microbacterium sp. 5K110]|jgi:hypothetical protein|uniref:hypothetical protein n=1 Tax=Microbacterium sp. 5K110 TaxID=2578104 RepID=UPI0010FE83E6|nr:hypothetical protein [Microbacterium sp. 5K110]TLF33246.1 hypothetical protein FE256_03895 [Microbacterium sp. 5K110]
MRTITLLWHLLLHWDHTPGSDSRDVICSCGRRWRILNQPLRCPVCGEHAIGVCCDIVSAYLSEENGDD